MIDILNTFAEFLIRSLKGLINFLEEIIPLIIKILFTASPFLAVIFLSYSLVGIMASIIVTVIVIAVILVGIVWAIKNKITGSKLSVKVIITVLVLDTILVAIGIFGIKNFPQISFTIPEGTNRVNKPLVHENSISQQDSNKEFYKLKSKEFY